MEHPSYTAPNHRSCAGERCAMCISGEVSVP